MVSIVAAAAFDRPLCRLADTALLHTEGVRFSREKKLAERWSKVTGYEPGWRGELIHCGEDYGEVAASFYFLFT